MSVPPGFTGCLVCDEESNRIAGLDDESRKEANRYKRRYSESERDKAIQELISGESYERHQERREEAQFGMMSDRERRRSRRNRN